MTPPIHPDALKHLLETLPPERDDPFPHLAYLSTNELLLRRIQVSQLIKSLEQERQVIDVELQEVYSDAELRFGVRSSGGWLLKRRTRTTWDYPAVVRDSIKTIQVEAQRNGQAQPIVSTYLCLNRLTE